MNMVFLYWEYGVGWAKLIFAVLKFVCQGRKKRHAMRAGWPCLVVHQIFSIFHPKLNTWLKSIFQIGQLHNLETIHASMLSMSNCPSDIYYPANHRCCPILLTGKGKARKKEEARHASRLTMSSCSSDIFNFPFKTQHLIKKHFPNWPSTQSRNDPCEHVVHV